MTKLKAKLIATIWWATCSYIIFQIVMSPHNLLYLLYNYIFSKHTNFSAAELGAIAAFKHNLLSLNVITLLIIAIAAGYLVVYKIVGVEKSRKNLYKALKLGIYTSIITLLLVVTFLMILSGHFPTGIWFIFVYSEILAYYGIPVVLYGMASSWLLYKLFSK